jgi:Na+-driven multidrug efflux pump
VVGDLLLIPQHGAAGAAVASAIAYLTTAGTLLLLFAVVRPAPIGRKVDEKKAMDRGPGRHRRGGLRDTERDKVG